jgi:hypothetical protein
MSLIGDLIAKLKAPVPGSPGNYYMSQSATNQVQAAVNKQNTPVIQYDNSGIFYLPTTLNIPGIGDVKGGATDASGEDFLQWTTKTYGSPSDPLGLNAYSAAWSAQLKSGGAPVVQYQQITPISIPVQPPKQSTPITSPGLPTAMSGESVIYTNGKITSIIK